MLGSTVVVRRSRVSRAADIRCNLRTLHKTGVEEGVRNLVVHALPHQPRGWKKNRSNGGAVVFWTLRGNARSPL
jgi:hypothetical protein